MLAADARLCFIPMTSTEAWVGWDEPRLYAIYYPVAGRLAPADASRGGGLDRLLGANRTALLGLLSEPAGLRGMRARVAEAGGTLTVDSSPGTGTRVSATVPS